MSISRKARTSNVGTIDIRFPQTNTRGAAKEGVQHEHSLQWDRRSVAGALLVLCGFAWAPARAQAPAQNPAERAPVSPFKFGAKGDGFADDTSAFEAALATGAPVDAGVGRFRLTRGLKVRAGQVLRGESSRACSFLIDHEFDGSAPAVIDLQGPEPGGELRDLSISFSQPTTIERARLLSYPAAIRAAGVPRFKLSRLRIERARVAIDMRGNSGGATIDDLEISAFDKAIWIDGSLDSVKITRLHVWPFGVTKLQRAIYDDANNEGLRVGRCDDLTVSQSLLFGLRKAAVFYRGDKGAAFGTLMGVDFDHCGGLICEAGNIRAIGCVFTLGVPDGIWLKSGQGLVSVVGGWFHANKTLANAGIASVGSGLLTMNDCNFSTGGNDFVHMNVGPNTTFNLNGLTFIKEQKQRYFKPLISIVPGAKGAMSSVVATPAASGEILQLSSKGVSGQEQISINGVQAPGWTVSK
jgi:hypothetical protein